MAEHIDVMISSTARDLPEHRAQVAIAIQKSSMFPLWMETLPALDADAIKASLDMVDRAEIYIGIFAHRYGYVPEGHDISITEMEYNRAVERGIPRLIFFMHEDHPIKAEDVETGPGADRLKVLKERIGGDRVANFFRSPADLRGQVLDALVDYRKGDSAKTLHSNLDIPAPPKPYIAHAYALLQTSGLIGRQAELTALTDWATQTDGARMLNVVAIGGMGKSALTWKWFNDIAPKKMKLAGRLWWSFYESNANWENVIIRALAYFSGRARADIEQNTRPGEREDMLWQILNEQPFLLVLDGLERILIAYARMDAAQLADASVKGDHGVRKTADPRAGQFLRRLATLRASRVLVSTRLFPADLETDAGDPRPGCARIDLPGLSDADALDLWRAFGVSGARDQLLPIFNSVGNHPLLVQALAGEIKKDRRARGDYDKWRTANPAFDPARHPEIGQRQAHVLEYALRGLDDDARQVLHTIAAFRMPTSQETLDALFVGEGRPFAAPSAFDHALTDLEDRGLVGWDRAVNRYDLHPIVRGVVWNGVGDSVKRDIYGTLESYFSAMPEIDEDEVESLDDLTPAIELYNALIGMERYDDAIDLFYRRLDDATLHRLHAARLRVELLEYLFPDGLDQPSPLEKLDDEALALNALAQSYELSGQPGCAVSTYRPAIMLDQLQFDNENLSIELGNLSNALYIVGGICEAEASAREALILTRKLTKRFLETLLSHKQREHFGEALILGFLGQLLAVRLGGEVGWHHDAPVPALPAFRRALRLFRSQSDYEGFTYAQLAQYSLWHGEHAVARRLADRGWELAQVKLYERHVISAACRQGQVAIGQGDFTTADERLHHALTHARAVNFTQEELPALTALAELRRQQGRPNEARDLLDQVWEGAERGPYPLLHSDALNVLAQIERDAGNTDAAVDAATNAYTLAWCDGISTDGSQCYAYWWGLQAARAHLDALGAHVPDLPPFTMDGREPMPVVEIDPDDEFHVGDRAVEDEI